MRTSCLTGEAHGWRGQWQQAASERKRVVGGGAAGATKLRVGRRSQLPSERVCPCDGHGNREGGQRDLGRAQRAWPMWGRALGQVVWP